MNSHLLILLSFVYVGCANTDRAEAKAAEYAQSFHPGEKVVALGCEGYDSDGDGRVRCNISFEDGEGQYVEFIECPSSWGPQFSSMCVGLSAKSSRPRRTRR